MSVFAKTICFIIGINFCVNISFSQSYCTFSIPVNSSVIDGVAIQPGDTICIESGTRDFLRFNNLTGTADLPIIIVNAGGQVIIDTDHYYGVKFDRCKFIKFLGTNSSTDFYGIKIRRVGNGAGISVDNLSTNVEIANIEIANTAIGGIYAKTDPDCSFIATREKFTMFDIKIHDCYLHDIQDEGMYIGSSKFTGQHLNDCDTTVLPHVIDGVKVYNNIVENTGWDGIQVSSAPVNCEIYGNIIRHDSWRETTNQMSGILIGGGSRCDCHNNKIFDGKGDGIDVFGSNTMKFYNNVIVRPGKTYFPNDPSFQRHGIFFGNPPDESFASWIIVFNTIIQPKTNGLKVFNNNTSGNFIYNNIICEPGAYSSQGDLAYFNSNIQPNQYTMSDNYFVNEHLSPKFVGFSSDNFDLLPNSPLINVAINLGNPIFGLDIENRPRPHNAGYDIGAFECQDVNANIQTIQDRITVNISPNPVHGILSGLVHFHGLENVDIKIQNIEGHYITPEIITENLPDGFVFSFDTSRFKNGLYFIKIQSNQGSFSTRFIVYK